MHNRTLIGVVIWIADTIDLHPALRGAVIGVVVSMAMAIPYRWDAGRFSDSGWCMVF